jgi:dipeptidase D
MESPLLDIAVSTYRRLFNMKPEVKAIHAGLECGLFLRKYPHMDMISIGPTIKGAHSPDERLHIESVGKFWDHLLEMLKNI